MSPTLLQLFLFIFSSKMISQYSKGYGHFFAQSILLVSW